MEQKEKTKRIIILGWCIFMLFAVSLLGLISNYIIYMNDNLIFLIWVIVGIITFNINNSLINVTGTK